MSNYITRAELCALFQITSPDGHIKAMDVHNAQYAFEPELQFAFTEKRDRHGRLVYLQVDRNPEAEEVAAFNRGWFVDLGRVA